MPENLFAACRVDGEFQMKRVQLQGSVQDQIEEIFGQQAQGFFNGIDDEIPFDGGWKPDRNQLLTIEITDEAALLKDTLAQSIFAVDPIDTENVAGEGIRAIFTGGTGGGNDVVLAQNFHVGQVLGRGNKISLIFEGNAFRRLDTSAFSLDSSLTFVVDGDLIKFKSFQKLRSILNVSHLYREATDPEVIAFSGHPSFDVDDTEALLDSADEVVRKLISSITGSNVLNILSPSQLQQMAKTTNLNLQLQNGKMVLPTDRRSLKDVLQFLNDDRWLGLLSGTPYVTNSKRNA